MTGPPPPAPGLGESLRSRERDVRVDDPVADAVLDPSRLAAVHELELSDAPQLDSLARLNRLAAELLDVAASAVSIISHDRQIVAGQVGLSDDLTEHVEWPLSQSLCQHVVRSGRELVIDDIHEGGRFDIEGLAAHHMIAYAGVPLRLSSGEVVGAFCAIDNAPRRWSEQQLASLADFAATAVDVLEYRRSTVGAGMRDPVTPLPRLALFTQQLDVLLGGAERSGSPPTLSVVDLAGFRLLNDAWGFRVGDAVLAEVTRRLQSIVAHHDGPGCVCRLAADTFLLAAATAPTTPSRSLTDRVRREITERPVEIEGLPQPIDARVTAIAVPSGATATQLINASSAAAVAAKTPAALGELGLPTSQATARQSLRIRNALPGVVERHELSLNYQAISTLEGDAIHGFEALLRWTHPVLGTVAPLDFISLAENSGAILPIGSWVVETALADLAGWRALESGQGLSVAVNVAPQQLAVSGFAEQVQEALAAAGVPAAALTLEITERTLVEDQATTRRTLRELRALGVAISLDDFGTGFSSLGRLSAFALDELKIDRVFVAELGRQPRHAALVAGIIAMAQAMGLAVVAEGIETDEQRALLIAMGCGYGQGYGLARPGSEADARDLFCGAVPGALH